MLYQEAFERFRSRALSGQVCLGFHCSTLSPQVVELLGLLGLDFAILSTEVESVDPEKLENLIRAAAATGMATMVKLRRNDVTLVSDIMNTGAHFIAIPHVTKRSELEAAVRATKFYPEGTRALCPAARYAGFGSVSIDHVIKTDAVDGRIIPIIEDKEALDNLDSLMTVPGVDIFEIGPFDLSHSLGLPPALSYGNPKTREAIDLICAAAKRHNKRLLAPTWLPREVVTSTEMIERQVQELVKRGITVLYHHAEVLVLARAYREMLPLRNAES